MNIDLIELKPDITVNRRWISEIFQSPIRQFDGCLKSDTFPIFVVNGSTEYEIGERSLEYRLFKHLSDSGHHFGLIHVMDEIYDHNLSVYGLKQCISIFREYYRPVGGKRQLLVDFGRSFITPTRYLSGYSRTKRLVHGLYIRIAPRYVLRNFRFMMRQYLPRLPMDKVFFIPLGYTDKLAENADSLPMAERSYKWSFCGDSFKADRKSMLRCLGSIHPSYIFEYQGFMSEGSLSGDQYLEVLLQSMFIPCPMGNLNIDTYRFFEALEAGAIPLILKSHAWQPYSYYEILLGKHPIPTFSSWKQAKHFLECIDPDSIEMLSQEVNRWYAAFKSDLKLRIRESLLKSAQNRLLAQDIHDLDSLCQR